MRSYGLNPFLYCFPDSVCASCMSKATDENGKSLTFEIDDEGVVHAKYTDSQEVYDSAICYVDGIRCRVEAEDDLVFGQVEHDATVIKFHNHAKYQEKLSEILEQVTEISTVIYENLFALACMGKWKEWDDQQPVGAKIFVDEDMIRNTGDKNIDLLLEIWDKIEEVKEEILG